MSEIEVKIEELRASVEAGRYRFDKDGDLDLRYVDSVVVPKLEEVLKGVCREVEEKHKISDWHPLAVDENKNRRDDNKIFITHYTGIDKIVSMIQNAGHKEQPSLWRLYDSVRLNDPEEGDYLVHHLSLREKHPWLGESSDHAYITSFIAEDAKKDVRANDDLVFWRTYGQEGEGCSLKIPVRLSSHLYSCLQEVRYGAREVSDTARDSNIHSVLDCLYPLVSIPKQPLRKMVRDNISRIVWRYLAGIRYLYKSNAYAYERELRVVIPGVDVEGEDRIHFDNTEQEGNFSRIRHYYEKKEFRVANMLITESVITLGPCMHYPYNVRYYLKNLLSKEGLLGPKIRISNIPYRNS